MIRRLIVCAALLAAGCARPPDAREPITIWGVGLGADSKGLEAVIRRFEEQNPAYRIRLTLSGSNNSPQKMMTSIVGGAPPDLFQFHAHLVPNWASRGALTPLDGLIARDRRRDRTTPVAEDYYPAAWAQVGYGGRVFGLPTQGMDRVLYWNREAFRRAAPRLRGAGLDPSRAPRTWSETLAYARALTERGKEGTLDRVGFVPLSGWHDLASWAILNDASIVSDDGKKCLLSDPKIVETLDFLKEGYGILGGLDEAARFNASFEGTKNDPFVTGKVAMKLDYPWTVAGLKNDAPGLDFGVAPPPVPDARYRGAGRFVGKSRWTAQGTFAAFAIPKGAKNVEGAWAFLKYVNSPEGRLLEAREQAKWEAFRGRTFYPSSIAANRVAQRAVEAEFRPSDPKYAKALALHSSLMETAGSTPPNAVAQLLEDQHRQATSDALNGRGEPRKLLAAANAVVQRQIDALASVKSLPLVDIRKAWAITALVLSISAVALYLWLRSLRMGRLARAEARAGFGFVAPWLLGFLGLTLGPMVASLLFSLTSYDVLNAPRWVGAGNYQEMATLDREPMIKAFGNVLYLGGLGIPLGIVSGLAVAMLLNVAARGMRVYRTLFFVPSIAPLVATAVLWAWILAPDPHKGLVNAMWNATVTPWFGIAPPGWFTSTEWAKRGLIVMGLWGAGGGMVLWLAALKGIPASLYEAASVDGATPRHQFWSITLPFLSPVLFFNMVMGVIGSLQEFERAFVVSGGGPGPGDALRMPAYHLFVNGFQYFRMGYASAIGWTLFAIVLLLTAVQTGLARRWVYYEAAK